MKKLFFLVIVAGLLLIAEKGNTQTIAAKTTTNPSPTPQNVLSWARELSPELEKVLPKIKRITPVTDLDRKAKARFEKAAQMVKEIIVKGENN